MAYSGLLMKSEEFLEQKNAGLESLLTTWRHQQTGALDISIPSEFCHLHTLHPVLRELQDILAVFKDEGVQVTLFPYFSEV